MRMLVLITDAFGGRGGIAKFNRDLLAVLCAHPEINEVVALPRLMPDHPGQVPEELDYRSEAAGSKWTYVRDLLKTLIRGKSFDVVLCGHINLLPLAALAAAWQRVPLMLIIHGIDAWRAPKNRLTRHSVSRVNAFVAVSKFTRDRFLAWSGLPAESGFVVPNCIDVSQFGPGPRSAALMNRYGLNNKTVLMTLSRLSALERYKGIDEVLEVLPDLVEEIPELVYIVAGDGDDRPRLEQKAHALGVANHVVFAGYLSEAEKTDHYRLADAFVMPGRGEGFGIVYLEALACGVPVIASTADASREAVLDGLMGQVVDPDRPEEIKRGIKTALLQRERKIPKELGYFSFNQFKSRWYHLLQEVCDINPPDTDPVKHFPIDIAVEDME